MPSSDARTPRSTAPKKTGVTAYASTPNPPPPDTTAYVAWLVVCLVWGTTYLAIRVAIETMPPFAMSGVRWILAGVILLAVMTARGEPLPPPRSWPRHALLGTLLMGVGNGGVVWAEQWVPSGLASLLAASTPFWLVGIERFSAQAEPLTPRRIAGFIVGFAGVVVLVWPDVVSHPSRGFWSGLIAIQCACLGWALGSNYARTHDRQSNVLVSSACHMLFGGLAMVVVALVLGEPFTGRFSTRSLIAFTYLLFAGGLIGYSAYAYALKHLPLSTVSLYAYINPVIAVALGALVLDEPMTLRLVFASAVVLLGTALVRRA